MSAIVFEFKRPGYPIANARDQAQMYCNILKKELGIRNVKYGVTNGSTIEFGDQDRITHSATVDFVNASSASELTEADLATRIISWIENATENVQLERQPSIGIDGQHYLPDLIIWEQDVDDTAGTDNTSTSNNSSAGDWDFIRTIGFCFTASMYLVDRAIEERGLQETSYQIKERKWSFELLYTVLRTFLILYALSELL